MNETSLYSDDNYKVTILSHKAKKQLDFLSVSKTIGLVNMSAASSSVLIRFTSIPLVFTSSFFW